MAKLVFGMNQSLDGYVDHMPGCQAPLFSVTSSRRLSGAGGQRLRSPNKEVMSTGTTIIP